MAAQLSIVEFGGALLRTRDLDPVYVAIAASKLDYHVTARLCLAYWCFYHLGVAARLAEIKQSKKFWETMYLAALNEGDPKPWPRGAERRHFRGKQAERAMEELIMMYGKHDPVKAVDGLLGAAPCDWTPTFQSISTAVQAHRGFGDWIAFKIADMAERVLGYPVDFDDCHLGIYKDPRQGAAVAYQETHHGQLSPVPWEYPITDEQLKWTVEYYIKLFRKKRAYAPPHYDRYVNVQEIETIFCKYKSHLKGHYPVGKDTAEIRHGLTGWGDLAETLQRNLPA
jgi:hypothetical protein